jgi:energy-converting hydrogenase A subunit M
MTTYLYEQDLVPQKYRIIVAMRHDTLVHQIARDLDMPVQEVRRYLIEHLDMLLLENLPARAEMADAHADSGDAVARVLGREKYTRYLGIISDAAMDSIYREVNAHVRAGTPLQEAITYGRVKIREELQR